MRLVFIETDQGDFEINPGRVDYIQSLSAKPEVTALGLGGSIKFFVYESPESLRTRINDALNNIINVPYV